MNHDWDEIMDRIIVIQGALDDHVRNHHQADDHLQKLIDLAQEILCEAHNYAGIKWDESYRNFGWREYK